MIGRPGPTLTRRDAGPDAITNSAPTNPYAIFLALMTLVHLPSSPLQPHPRGIRARATTLDPPAHRPVTPPTRRRHETRDGSSTSVQRTTGRYRFPLSRYGASVVASAKVLHRCSSAKRRLLKRVLPAGLAPDVDLAREPTPAGFRVASPEGHEPLGLQAFHPGRVLRSLDGPAVGGDGQHRCRPQFAEGLAQTAKYMRQIPMYASPHPNVRAASGSVNRTPGAS